MIKIVHLALAQIRKNPQFYVETKPHIFSIRNLVSAMELREEI